MQKHIELVGETLKECATVTETKIKPEREWVCDSAQGEATPYQPTGSPAWDPGPMNRFNCSESISEQDLQMEKWDEIMSRVVTLT